MKAKILATFAALAIASPAFAEGDAAKGESDFKKCKSCHMIVGEDGTEIQKGGKTGPNLYGIIGRTVGSTDFKYGDTKNQRRWANPAWSGTKPNSPPISPIRRPGWSRRAETTAPRPR